MLLLGLASTITPCRDDARTFGDHCDTLERLLDAPCVTMRIRLRYAVFYCLLDFLVGHRALQLPFNAVLLQVHSDKQRCTCSAILGPMPADTAACARVRVPGTVCGDMTLASTAMTGVGGTLVQVVISSDTALSTHIVRRRPSPR